MNRLQEKILEIFQVVADICSKHNLRYFAIGGTCIGAVRHGGFIPWDDDLDIAMPRADFEKFKEVAKYELPANYKIMDEVDAKYYTCHFMKVHDTSTTFIEKSCKDFPERWTGVYVDIMPLDGIPKGKLEKKLYFLKLRNLYRLNFYKIYRPKIEDNDSTVEITKKLGRKILYPVLNLLPYNYFKKIYVGTQKKYDYDDTDELGYTWSAPKKLTFPKEDFEEYIELPFESTTMRCPKGYDRFLRTLFGDYMDLPPEEEQKPHHEFEVLDLDRPYEYYLNRLEK